MERLVRRSYILAGALAVFGLAFAAVPRAAYVKLTEDQMEEKAPGVIEGFRFVPGPDDPGQTNKMDKQTYDTLKPYGIVSRVYAKGNRMYDVVLIAGNDSQTFHDPRVCFTAQGYRITRERQLDVKTKTRGDVQVTYADMAGRPGIEKAIFFYRTPYRFTGKTGPLKLDMFRAQLSGKSNYDSVFYRVIPLDPKTTEQELLDFTRDFIDAANDSSQGYF